jgi:hypothetical protein
MAPPESLVGAAAGAVITLGVSLLGSALGNRKNGKDKTVSTASLFKASFTPRWRWQGGVGTAAFVAILSF